MHILMEVMTMKTMTKIKLINWHIFDNHTIEINHNTLITGENGHGKSTLLDAVNFVLSGASGKFNQAANTNTKRTIESYVKGKTGIEGKTFIREQDQIISHIALEFYDKLTKKYLTIGVVFELPFSKHKNHGTFYHISDSKLLEDYYIYNHNILGLSQFKQAVKAKDKTVNTFETKRDIKTMIKSTLGLSSDKYFELLPKALAFHPINEVNQFVYDFLLPEDRVDIESLQTNIHSYREVSKLLKIEKEKLEFLKPLENLAAQYKEIQSNINILEYLKVDLKYEAIQKSIDNENQNLRDTNLNYDQALIDQSEIETKLLAVETSLNELQKNDMSLRIDSLEKQLQDERQKLTLVEHKLKNVLDIVKSEVQLAKRIELDFKIKDLLNSSGHHQLVSEIKAYDHLIDEKKSELTVVVSERKKELDKVNDEKTELTSQIKKLESNRFTYDFHVESLLAILKEELAIEFNKDYIDVKPLCELLDIEKENDEWRNAIEGYLNTQRFDIIVEPQYFNKALEIYEKHKFKKKIHGVGLINTNKLNGYVMEQNSLASKVNGLNEFARQAVNMIMGKVICVDDIQELKSYSQSITASGMTYRNNTARQINQTIWERPFIGQKAIEKQLENARAKENELDQVINSLTKKINDLSNKIYQMKQSRIRELLNMPNHFKDKVDLELKMKSSLEELTILKKDNAWLEVAERIEQKKKEKYGLATEKDLLVKKIGILEDNIKNIKTKITVITESLSDMLSDYDALPDMSKSLQQIQDKKKILKVTNKENYDKMIQSIQNENSSLSRTFYSQEAKILDLMKEYTQKYDNGQLIADIHNLNDYMDVYYRIKGRNIIEFEDKAAIALSACEKSFKEDFLSKLREKIQTAQEGFYHLNKALKTKPFGSEKEVYTFTYSGSNNPNFKDYYTILQSSEDYVSKSLLVESLSEKNLILLKTLFETLTSEDKSEAQVRRIAEFTDYRKYMDYDIKITNRKDETYYFSKVNKEKSGGETQTPFYVIIASSFQQLLDSSRKNRSSACVVMFDEAFNNMDESRIEAMMEYYNELNIQLLIAVPPQRLVNIVPYVETTLGLIKSNHTVVVHSWKEHHQEAKNEEV